MAKSKTGAWPTIFALTLLGGLASAPKQDQLHSRRAIHTVYKQAAPFSSQQKAWIDHNCGKFGLPLRLADEKIGPSAVIAREGYVLEHSSELLTPLWVCERLDQGDLPTQQGTRLDPEPFEAEPILAGHPRAELIDYAGSGFDRGHMSPDANRNSIERKTDTYFLSNMVPQVGIGFNRSKWKDLEAAVRGWAQKYGTVYIITGGFIHDPDEENPATADGIVQFIAVGKHGVGVPTHVYKIVMAEVSGPGRWESLAWVMENRVYQKSEQLPTFLKSIDWIEDRSGFNFFPDLSATEEARLERKAAVAQWP